MRYTSFIQGINVGRAKREAMVELRALAGELGFTHIRTLRNSGNLVFNATKNEGKNASRRIEKEINSRLDIAARVITLTAEELEVVINENPFGDIVTNPVRFIAAVVEDPAELQRLQPLVQQEWIPEMIAIGSRVAYLWCPGGVLASPLAKEVQALLGSTVTMSNWTTITKLQQLSHLKTA